jgi:tRNA pseudouridine38-40 synthase
MDLAYDGSDFWGWQRQPGRRTVQGVLEATLGQILDGPVHVTGAGRTDRGVHATGQVAHAEARRELAPHRLGRALRALLPRDLALRRIVRSADGFHARYDARRRHYVYLVADRPSPFTSRYTGPVRGSLDLAAMQAAARSLRGQHDFRPFAVRAGDIAGGLCDVERAGWSTWRGGWRFTISADRFLMRMVRMLVGTMIEIGRGRRPPTELAARLSGAAETLRPAAVSAGGLYLAGVGYGAGAGWEEAHAAPSG